MIRLIRAQSYHMSPYKKRTFSGCSKRDGAEEEPGEMQQKEKLDISVRRISCTVAGFEI